MVRDSRCNGVEGCRFHGPKSKVKAKGNTKGHAMGALRCKEGEQNLRLSRDRMDFMRAI